MPEIGKPFHVDSTKITSELSFQPRDLEEMTIAMAESMIHYGIVKKP